MKVLFSLLFSTILFSGIAQADSRVVEQTLTTDTSAYAAADTVDGKITFTNAWIAGKSSGVIHYVTITDLDAQSADLDVYFFTEDPSATTFTDNAALDIADADLPKTICPVVLSGGKSFADNSVQYVAAVNCPIQAQKDRNLYAVVVARGAVTYTSADALTLRVGILQD